jgi:hypothetical protein
VKITDACFLIGPAGAAVSISQKLHLSVIRKSSRAAVVFPARRESPDFAFSD